MTALGSLLLCRLLTCWSVLRTRVDSEAYVQVFFRAKARQSCVCNLIQTCGPTETKLQTHSSRGANLTQPPLSRDCMHTSTLCEATSRLASLWTWWLWLRCWTAQLEQGVIERGRLSLRHSGCESLRAWRIDHRLLSPPPQLRQLRLWRRSSGLGPLGWRQSVCAAEFLWTTVRQASDGKQR